MAEIEIPTDFKTTLAPRKRAKTKEEKEQRRVERILRNRKAAHASREKKRKHVEFLEKFVLDLEKQNNMFKTLNKKLLESHYKGGDADVDKMVSKIQSLPDLEKVKQEHNIELDDKSEEQYELPRTPESFSSFSPKNNEEFDVPERQNRANSKSSIPELTMSQISPLSSPETTTNKFSLDIIDPSSEQLLFNDIFVKNESEDVAIPDFIKKEDDSVQFPEQLTTFGDFQANTFDSQIGFDELRNPEAPSNLFDLNDFVLLE